MSTLDDEERCLREVIALLHEEYARAAKPYIDRLVTLHCMRPPAPLVLPLVPPPTFWTYCRTRAMRATTC
jgi:hypothetical protein